jgi:hypothetical protein
MDMMLDEKIAILEKEKRYELRNEDNKNSDISNGIKSSLEKLISDIKLGKVFVGFNTLEFEKREITKEKLVIPFASDFFENIEEQENIVSYENYEEVVSLIITLLYEKKKRPQLKAWQKSFKKDMLETQRLYVSITKSCRLKNLDYLCYETPTSKGRLYNVMFQYVKDDMYYVGVFICENNKKDTIGIMLEAIVNVIDDYN